MQNSQRVSMPLAAVLFLISCSQALAQTVVFLNTGYNHASGTPYTTVTTPTSTTNDNYWINIASYPPVSTPAPSWVLRHPGLPWAAALPDTHWISARPTAGSPGTTNDPAYTIFRKCFCMLSEYTQPLLQFTVRADDTIQVWFNTQLNVVLPASPGNFSGPVLTSLSSKPGWFRPGRNCLYVLVENYTGYMGFDMRGVIQAYGLMPGAAAGATQQFPCPCDRPAGASARAPARRSVVTEDEVVKALKQIAERRRLARVRKQLPR
jgi:hypothetical protein